MNESRHSIQKISDHFVEHVNKQAVSADIKIALLALNSHFADLIQSIDEGEINLVNDFIQIINVMASKRFKKDSGGSLYLKGTLFTHCPACDQNGIISKGRCETDSSHGGCVFCK
ncbi:MAG: hypothetical protein GY710_13070 [Desulfobacteraceae bacterium]|nr:hypothetical protein [Desulfobacteraceae bacterium]